MPQCNPQRLCLSLPRPARSHSPGPGLWALPSPARASGIIQKEVKIREHAPRLGESRSLCLVDTCHARKYDVFGRAAFLSSSPSIKRVLTKSQNGNLGPLVSSPSADIFSGQPHSKLRSPRRNNRKAAGWQFYVGHWHLLKTDPKTQSPLHSLIGQLLLSVSLPLVRALYHAVFLKAHGSRLTPRSSQRLWSLSTMDFQSPVADIPHTQGDSLQPTARR